VVDDTQTSAYSIVVSGDYLFYTTGFDDTVAKVLYNGNGGPILFTGQTDAFQIATDGVGVYWTDYFPGSYVNEAPVDGGAGATVIALAILPMTEQIGGGGIAAYGGMVYWTTYGPPGVMSIATSSTSQNGVFIADADGGVIDGPGVIAVNDADYVYWGDTGGVFRLSLAVAGAQPEMFAPDDGVGAIALDADTVYWIGSGVSSKPKAAPPSQNAHLYFQGSASAIATDGAYVYWLTPEGAVSKVAKGGLSVLQVAATPPAALVVGSPQGLAVDCGAVYWTLNGDGSTQNAIVYRAAKGP
jgi:hypothetical protein